jgi:anti-anti-sigma factor
MAIKVTCPNGHVLDVKDKYAGKSGLCPLCRARVEVPQPEQVSDDEVLAILGPPKAPPPTPTPSEEFVHQDPRHDEVKKESGVSLLGSSLLRRKKACPKCGDIVSFAFAVCPRCGTPLSAGTGFLSEETAKQPAVTVYHYLGVRKQGDVMVVRFGEHRIPDDLAVEKVGDELDSVADRPDCFHLLLNFASVASLSSLMLKRLLTLQRKVESKGGKLKLCQVGSEIQQVFTATAAGRSFGILDSERDGLKAFAPRSATTSAGQ